MFVAKKGEIGQLSEDQLLQQMCEMFNIHLTVTLQDSTEKQFGTTFNSKISVKFDPEGFCTATGGKNFVGEISMYF